MSRKKKINRRKSTELIFSEIEREKKLTLKEKYRYLEQLRDYIYKDVVLADNKAGLALTMITVIIATALTLFKEANIFWIIGLIFSAFSIFCSMLTILPRSYVTHDMVKNSDHWVNLKKGWLNELNRRYRDAFNVLFENLWQKQSEGTTNSLKSLLNSGTEAEVVNSLYEAMQRAFIAQTLKYLWVGKALGFAFLAFCFIALSFAIEKFDNISSESSKNEITISDSTLLNDNKIRVQDTTFSDVDNQIIIQAKLDSTKKNE